MKKSQKNVVIYQTKSGAIALRDNRELVKKPTKRKVALTGALLSESVAVLKGELMRKGEATELFAAERSRDASEEIVGNVMQAVADVRALLPRGMKTDTGSILELSS